MAICSVKVDAPATAKSGERVQAAVTVTNLNPPYYWIFLTEIWAEASRIGQWDEVIAPNTSKTYYGYFTMPAGDVTVLGWVDRVSSLEPYKVVFCGADSKLIALEVAPVLEGWRKVGVAVRMAIAAIELPPVLEGWRKVGAAVRMAIAAIELPPVLEGWRKVGVAVRMAIESLAPVVPPPEGWHKVGVPVRMAVAAIGFVPPPEEKEFPWGTALLVGGGAALALAAAKGAKKKA